MNRLNEFIQNSNFTERTKYQIHLRLRHAFDFFRSIHTAEDFLQIKPSEFKQYFQAVDKLEVLAISKKRYRFALKDFCDYFTSDLIAANQIIPTNYDFIFSDRFYTFKNDGHPTETRYIEYNDIRDIIAWAKFTQPPMIFFAIAVQITTGCRVGGLLSIAKTSIDLDKRQIETREKTGHCNYVLAEPLVEPLRNYIAYLPPTQHRLFPISQQKFNQRLKRFKPWLHSNCFRDALNCIWEDLSIEESIRDIMCCRIPQAVNARHYMKKFRDWEKRVARYDEIYPFTDIEF